MKCEVCKDREAVVKESYGLKCPQCWLEVNARVLKSQRLLDKEHSMMYPQRPIKPT